MRWGRAGTARRWAGRWWWAVPRLGFQRPHHPAKPGGWPAPPRRPVSAGCGSRRPGRRHDGWPTDSGATRPRPPAAPPPPTADRADRGASPGPPGARPETLAGSARRATPWRRAARSDRLPSPRHASPRHARPGRDDRSTGRRGGLLPTGFSGRGPCLLCGMGCRAVRGGLTGRRCCWDALPWDDPRPGARPVAGRPRQQVDHPRRGVPRQQSREPTAPTSTSAPDGPRRSGPPRQDAHPTDQPPGHRTARPPGADHPPGAHRRNGHQRHHADGTHPPSHGDGGCAAATPRRPRLRPRPRPARRAAPTGRPRTPAQLSRGSAPTHRRERPARPGTPRPRCLTARRVSRAGGLPGWSGPVRPPGPAAPAPGPLSLCRPRRLGWSSPRPLVLLSHVRLGLVRAALVYGHR